jgi:deoxyadenosine/deoxycytidine kinase
MNSGGHALLDSSFYSDTCFARMMHRTGEISTREFETYRVIYQAMTASVLLPSVCVRMQVDPMVAAERIRSRASKRDGRKSELVIDHGYLQALDQEIDVTVSVLRSQGVRVINLPWDANQTTEQARAADVAWLAKEICETRPPDLFLQHHRRVIG